MLEGMVPVSIHIISTIKFDLELAKIVLHVDNKSLPTIPISEDNLSRSTIYLKPYLQLTLYLIFQLIWQ